MELHTCCSDFHRECVQRYSITSLIKAQAQDFSLHTEKAVPKGISNTQRLETYNVRLEIMRKWRRRKCRQGSSKNKPRNGRMNMERMASDPLPFSPVPSRACTHTQVSSSQQPEDQKRLHVEAVLTLRSQTSLRCYCDDLPRKSNTYNSRKEFYLWAFSLLPSRDQCKTKGREKMAPKKKKKPTSEKF